jgi:hypothetical protein
VSEPLDLDDAIEETRAAIADARDSLEKLARWHTKARDALGRLALAEDTFERLAGDRLRRQVLGGRP